MAHAYLRSTILLAAACLGLVGCSSLLPRGSSVVDGPWKSFENAQQTFDRIVPYQTTTQDLKALGLDPQSSPNVTLLNYSDVLVRFMSSQISSDELEGAVRECIQAKAACKGFEIEQKSLKRTRAGNFWADFLNFKRRTEIRGWHFKGMLLVKGDTVVFKQISGLPQITAEELNRNPLGPFQGVGESTLSNLF